MKKVFLFIAVAFFSSCSTQRNTTICSAQLSENITRLQVQVDSLINALQVIKIPDSSVNNGAMGDVKYSILSVNAFQKENGYCWQLLDSTFNFATSELFKKYSSVLPAILPDGRGVFIRGMMTDTSKAAKENGDPNGIREIGGYQKDLVGTHSHELNRPRKWGRDPDGTINTAGWGAGNQYFPNETFPTTVNCENCETRPKNIALYVYIKVCNER